MDETVLSSQPLGIYKITESDAGIFLTVYPAVKGFIEPANESVILNDLKKRNIIPSDPSVITRATAEASGLPVQIALPFSSEVLSSIQVMVRRDRRAAMISLSPSPALRNMTKEHLLEKLKLAGVVYGIDQHALDQMLRARAGMVTCAHAALPRDGDDAFLNYHIDIEAQGRPVVLEDGRVDFKNINNFISVEEGQLLAEKIPPTAGIDGTDVLGFPILAKPGKDRPMPLGKNITVVDNCKLVAAIAGQLHIKRNQLHVLSVLEIADDVDYNTGNIDFIGSVRVRGSLQPGFHIAAKGNVEILGSICGGSVECMNLIVRQGIQGMNRSTIKAHHSVFALFIENASVYADYDIVVQDVILNSSVFAGLRVMVEGSRGRVVGGRISAGEVIRLATAGNQSQVTTSLEVSSNPFLKDELVVVKEEIKVAQKKYEEFERVLSFLRAQGIEQLTAEKRNRYEKMEVEFQTLPEYIQEKEDRISDLQDLLASLTPGKIFISNVVFAGVKLSIGLLTKTLDQSFKYISFYAHEGEIRFTSYR